MLGDALRSMLEVDVGETVEVTVADNGPVPVTVAGFVHERLGSLAYTTLARAQHPAAGDGEHSLLASYRKEQTGLDPWPRPCVSWG